MFRFTTSTCLLLFSFISLPQTAQAANFGFVRWPGYLDMPIIAAMLMTGLSFVLLKTQMPKGAKDFVSVPKDERSVMLKASAFLMLVSFVVCLGMIFVGMGLQRAVE
ncbi:hypothetical protein GGR95_000149 [Sulfitobacter undariae]|uniref:Uncharacterized protein n=1 Tax=Sulfitobacter undariae TaxID=1563671 RepID=A0A7W6E0K2_9RHOB|nr:hypothetical protein [Sulfitobacter undariae]MBB3992530.1 hypothetical protein [Sulfitobacter undariae]